jgi:HD-GYP domain-containing protein (c-di-GMP phosphodiesterase class II)
LAWDDIPDWSSTVADALLQTVKMKDPFTFYHCCRVGRAARRLAQAAGLNEYDQHRLEFSGLFHDVGKVGIPDNILLKPGSLTSQEFETMKSHALKSAEIIEPLNHIAFFKSLLPGIRSHHERIDGRGYPYNLEGDKIPLTARIITIVDTVDAMMHTRPYRKGLSFDIVKQELQEFSGSQFDAQLVKIYLDAIRFWKADQEADKEEMVIGQILKKSA